jgi:thiol:disulfide interchange protein DsbA
MLFTFLRVSLAVVGLLLACGQASAQFSLGRDYYALQQAQPMEADGKIEVAEFFHYGCGHCANLEPRLEAWAKTLPADVRLARVPTNFRLMGIDALQLFYTLQAMGQLEKLHARVFVAAHKENEPLGNAKALDGWLKKNGVDTARYQEVAKSFSLQSRYNRAVQLQQQFRVDTVPTLVVGGKYVIKNTENVFAVADFLINQVRRETLASAPAVIPAAAPAKK